MSTDVEWFYIDAPGSGQRGPFTAAMRFTDGTADHSAPILAWMKGRSLNWVTRYCRGKGWKMERLK